METFDPESDHVTLENNHGSRFCCCCFPKAQSYWRRTEPSSPSSSSSSSWWRKTVGAFMKVREWSELVAGPRWKNFIRRFNNQRQRNSRFHYDPLSYAMNFDEGIHEDEGNEEFAGGIQRGFSSRYVVSSSVPFNSSTTTVAAVGDGGRESPRLKL